MKKKALWYLTGFMLLASAAGLQAVHDRLYPQQELSEFHYIPNGEFLRLIMPHMAQAASDVYWVKAVLYFGRRIEETEANSIGLNLTRSLASDTAGYPVAVNEKYRILSDILRTVVALDPYFEYPYLFGGLFLSMAGGMVDDAIDILEKGESRFPENWRFPYYLGFNHYFFKNNTVQALKEFVQAAAIPGRPAILYSTIQTIAQKESKQDVAENFLEGAAMNSENDRMREELETLLNDIRNKSNTGENPRK